jgi:hypothetical protein
MAESEGLKNRAIVLAINLAYKLSLKPSMFS